MSGPIRFGQDLAEDDADVARAERAARLDELPLAQREREAAHDPRDVRPREERDHRDHEPYPGLDRVPARGTPPWSCCTPRRCRSRSGAAAARASRRRSARAACRPSRGSSRRAGRRRGRSAPRSPEATTPTISDVRAPYIVRTKRSRPVAVGAEPEVVVRARAGSPNSSSIDARVGRRVRVARDPRRRSGRRRSR